MEHRSTKRRLATLGLTAGLVASGALAGATLGTPTMSGAQDTETTVPTDETTTDDATTQARPEPGERFGEVIQPLVDDGTITQDQADAVIAALAEAGPPAGHQGPGGHHGPMNLDPAATALGMTADELATALRDGSSIAEVAAAQGVDVQVVIDALVAELQEHLDEEVASGDKTQEEADSILAQSTERITAMVNGETPADGPGMGRPGMDGPRGPHGPHGPFGGDEADDTTDTTTS